MDCRRSAVLSLVALSVLWISSGCIGTQNQQRPAPPPTVPDNIPPEAIKKESDAPKRPPKASTVVAFAACKESEAANEHLDARGRRILLDEARKGYQEALQFDNACLAAYVGLARVYRDVGDYERALDVYRKGMDKHPREVGLWVEMGMCQARRKDFDGAIRTLQRAVEMDPEHQEALKTLGFLLARTGRTDESVLYLARCMTPADANVQVARMVLHLQAQGTVPQATAQAAYRRHLEAALQCDPNMTVAREMLTQIGAAAAPTQSFRPPYEGQ
jgi:Tfp pilus assembly protein PilF